MATMQKILKSEKKEILITLLVFCVFVVVHFWFKVKLNVFASLNGDFRQMVSIFTGMLGTMVGLIFASNMGRVLKNMNTKVGLWPIKYRIISSFVSALLFLSFSLIFEILNKISQECINFLTVGLLIILFIYFMTSISHTVEVVIKSTFAGLEDKLNQNEYDKKYY